MNGILKRSLTPDEVEEALGITFAERVRWTKARLLPVSGQGSFKKGQVIYFAHFAPKKIAEIAANPGLIAGWRMDDEEV